MPDETENIDTWEELLVLIKRWSDRKWIFRGVTSAAEHILIPKIGRPIEGIYTYLEKEEKRAFEQFKLRAIPFLEFDPRSDWDWLAVAQHHGLPTRLLDWTWSPLVAAFFAVEEAGAKGDAGIYAWHKPEAVNINKEYKPFNVNSVRFFEPPHIARRIPAQNGLFTIHPSPADVWEHENISKIVIRRSVCLEIKFHLDTCAVNSATLFPDLDGISKHIGWRVKWAKKWEELRNRI